jgi:hypothetical protein
VIFAFFLPSLFNVIVISLLSVCVKSFIWKENLYLLPINQAKYCFDLILKTIFCDLLKFAQKQIVGHLLEQHMWVRGYASMKVRKEKRERTRKIESKRVKQ